MNANVVSLSGRTREMGSITNTNRIGAARRLPRVPALACATTTLLLTLGLPARGAYQAAAEGSHVAVATDNADATHAAITAMRGGGNAFDGAIAAALALGVASPSASGLGGGGFALVYIKSEHRVVALDFREISPIHAGEDSLVVRGKRGT